MKIVNRATFLSMPAGTVYIAASHPYAWGDIQIKDDTSGNDWYYSDLTSIDADDSGDLVDRWEDMLNNVASHPLDLETLSRDGMYEPDAIFMIYEKHELQEIADLFARLAK